MKIYADNAATTRMSQAAIDTMLDCMNNVYGNPSSLYTLGQKAKERLEETREEIAKIINAEPREIIFTSGGSEADNQAIISAANIGKKKGKTHIISTALSTTLCSIHSKSSKSRALKSRFCLFTRTGSST